MRIKTTLLRVVSLLLLVLLITKCGEALNPVVAPENASTAGILEDCFNNINGTAWVDSTQDGVIDAEEVLFNGVDVFLVNAEDETLSVTTDENGYFEFTGICAGSYELEFEVPEGYDHLSPDDVELILELTDEIITINLALFVEEEAGDDDDDDDDDDGELLEGDDDDDCETDEGTARAAIDDAWLALADTTLFFDGDLSGLDLTEVYEKLTEAGEKLEDAEEKFAEGKYCDALDKVQDANDKIADALEKYDDLLAEGLEGDDDDDDDDFEELEAGDDDDDDDDDDKEKVKVCHKGKTKTIPASALDKHLGHGDTEGGC
jgi:hypothetical protein